MHHCENLGSHAGFVVLQWDAILWRWCCCWGFTCGVHVCVFKCLVHVKVTFMNAMNTQVIPGEHCAILRLLILFTLWFLIMQRYSHDLSLNTAHTFLPPQVDVLHPC